MNTQKVQKRDTQFIENLINLSVRGLIDLFDHDKMIFAEKMKKVNGEMVVEGNNTRYDLINLLGLFKAHSHNIDIQIDIRKVLIKQIENQENFVGVGEIGLLLWSAALIAPDEINKIITKYNFSNILEKFPDSQNKLTMELSWFLTGLQMASTFNKAFKSAIGDLPQEVYKQIRNNYGGYGIFRHQDNSGLSGKLRGGISSFADQVYPIYALSLYSQQKRNKEAMLIAKECAEKLCEHQGPDGEWAWHYDSNNGKIISTYPVYSVHQDAMAPIALYAIQKASETSFEKYIMKGLYWLENQKSVCQNMISYEDNIIWRAVEPKKTRRKIKSTLAHFGFNTAENYNNLEIVEECWSYHFGWLLYAFAGRIDDFEKNNSGSSLHDKVKIYHFGKV